MKRADIASFLVVLIDFGGRGGGDVNMGGDTVGV